MPITLSELGKEGNANNYRDIPLLESEKAFAKVIIEKHLAPIFILATVTLSEYYSAQQKIKDENAKLRIVIDKQKIENLTLSTQKGLEEIPKLESSEAIVDFVDKHTDKRVKKATASLEQKLIKKGILKSRKNSTGARANPPGRPGNSGTLGNGRSSATKKTVRIQKGKHVTTKKRTHKKTKNRRPPKTPTKKTPKTDNQGGAQKGKGKKRKRNNK